MKDKTTHLYVDSHERTLILHSLVELKNALISYYQRRIRQCRKAGCFRNTGVYCRACASQGHRCKAGKKYL